MFWYMQQHRRMCREWAEWKRVSQVSHTVWLHLHHVIEIKIQKWSKVARNPCGHQRREVDMSYKRQHEGPLWGMECSVSWMFCMHVKILVLLLCYNFTRYSHWGKVDNAHREPSLHYLLQLQVNLSFSENRKFKEKQ